MVADETKCEIALCVYVLALNSLLKNGLVTATEYEQIQSLGEKRYRTGLVH